MSPLPSAIRSLPFILACAALLVFGVAPLRAQFEIGVKLNKETYLTYEGVEATVTITNRSGADIVMGGPSDTAWLNFEITDPQGKPVPPMAFRSEETMVFKSGATLRRKVTLSEQYTFSDYGNYTVVANVYHPPTQQYYASNRAHSTFTDAKPFWTTSFGVPLGLPGAGQIRRYELSIMRDLERTNLYVRLMVDKGNVNLSTFTLGNCIMVADPQITLGKDNKLNVLFMTAPHVYAHIVVDTQGRIVKRLYYREMQTNRPHLVVDASQAVTVQGGETYDPTIPVVTRPPGRSVKEKPPGL